MEWNTRKFSWPTSKSTNYTAPLFTHLAFFCILLGVCILGACGNAGSPGSSQEKAPELVIWTYDSFNSEWGPGPGLAKQFLEETGIAIRWVNHQDAGSMLSRLLLEGSDAQGDIILGLDQNMASRALESGLLAAYTPEGFDNILPELLIDPTNRLIPFDYSYFAVVYNSEELPNPPRNLEDLASGEYRNSLILLDPRTSSPGLGFFAWTREAYGSSWPNYWQRLRPSILTIAESWSSGYGLFTAGEAPMVLSYTTSPGYHLEYENTEIYRAAIFEDGHPIQIELAGLLSTAANREQAERFLDFMLNPSFQSMIPLTNWMYPATPIELPDSFWINPKSDTPLYPMPPTEAELNEWSILMSQR